MRDENAGVFKFNSDSGYIKGFYPSDTPKELRYKLNEGAILTEMNECALHDGVHSAILAPIAWQHVQGRVRLRDHVDLTPCER